MLVNGRNYRTIRMQNSSVFMINQLLLPHKFDIYESKSYLQTAGAIKTMIVRGAPAIGAAGAFGMAQASLEFTGTDFKNFKIHLEKSAQQLKSTRPTANDLFYAVDSAAKRILGNFDVHSCKKSAVKFADEYADWSAETCRKIGERGNMLIKDGQAILTHCNAGALACVDYGTALSPIRAAHSSWKKIFVYADETRPRNQGLLTAWELANEGIPHSIIADNAAGHFMKQGKISLAIVGADRIAMNGDVANKIGTYEKAVLAKENNIPFYVAAPMSTFDADSKSGNDITIEERNGDELLYVQGIDGKNEIMKIRIAPAGSNAKNPAFDVTPAKYITGIITENGIISPNIKEISKFIRNKD